MKSQETIQTTPAQQLRDAASSGDLAALKRLIQEGVPVNDRSNFNNTALLYAAMHGKRDCVQFLIDSGADVNIANNSGYTPLICAAKIGAYEIVQMLLASGAEKHHALLNEDGSPSLPPRTALTLAKRNHHFDVVEMLGGVGTMQAV